MTRRTNLALAAVLGLATASGILALLVGEGRAAVVVWAHGAAAFAVLALIRPKGRIAVRGTARRGRAAAPGLLLGGLVVASMGLGVAHATGVGALGPLTALGWHIGIALAAIPIAAAHVWKRPPRPRRGDLTRGALLRAAGLAAAGVAAKLAFERLAGAPRAATGSLPRAFPVPTAWLDDTTPGAVRTEFTAERLAAHPQTAVECTLDCTSGWYSRNRWSGVALTDLLGPLPAGTRSIDVRSETGYSRRFGASDIEGLILATHVDGRPLSPDHGAPARLVAPGRRGYWWVKWVTAVETSDVPAWLQPPFPLT
jgi:molybdopterin-dependent oxidoreductase-like protein protein